MGIIKWLILFSLIGNIALADDAVYLDKDQKAPFSGYLLTKDMVLDYRNNKLENETKTGVIGSLNTSIKLQEDIIAHKDEQLSLALNQMDTMAKTAYSASSMNTWERIGWVSLGIVIAGLAVKGAHELYK